MSTKSIAAGVATTVVLALGAAVPVTILITATVINPEMVLTLTAGVALALGGIAFMTRTR